MTHKGNVGMMGGHEQLMAETDSINTVLCLLIGKTTGGAYVMQMTCRYSITTIVGWSRIPCLRRREDKSAM
jgi:hypothetical protein